MSEHDEQVKVVRWCRSAGKILFKDLFVYSIPNAAKRGYQSAAWLIAEGLTAGVPDLCIATPRGNYGALYIEMKYGKNTLTDDQKRVIPLVSKSGNKCVVCYSAKEAIAEIEKYLSEA